MYNWWNFLGPTVDTSLNLLHEAKDHLQKVLQHKMDEAINDGDAASVERFFKIFPLLNMQEEGIQKFSSYLALKVSVVTMKNRSFLKCAILVEGKSSKEHKTGGQCGN